MLKNQLFLLLHLFLIATAIPSHTYGQHAGELVDIQYPLSIKAGEKFSVTMTVTNRGPGVWINVCAYVGYMVPDEENTLPVVSTCPNLGTLEPGKSAVFNCSTATGIPGTAEMLWAGVGAPFG